MFGIHFQLNTDMNLNMLRKFRAIIFVAGFGFAAIGTFFPVSASATVLEASKDQNFANTLASLEMLDEIQLRSGFQVRVFRTSDSGECDPGTEASSCPKSQLYVVSSLVLEGPSNNTLWTSERLIHWKMVKKLSEDTAEYRSKDEENFGVVVFEMSVCRAPKMVESGKENPRTGGWWHVIRYNVRVTNVELIASEIPSKSEPEVCELY